MKRILATALIGMSIATVACKSGDSTGPLPANAMNGLYAGSTDKADIRLQVAYGKDPAKCQSGNAAERAICDLLADNLYGTGSVTVRATGEVQSFQFAGGQVTNVVLVFDQLSGVMVDTWLVGSASTDGKTVSGMLKPRSGKPASATFGDSTAITFVRSPGS
jgi:hypothetical protein